MKFRTSDMLFGEFKKKKTYFAVFAGKSQIPHKQLIDSTIEIDLYYQ